ncbi:Ribosomal-protein-serine acetyltransferase [Klebsiella pneumoniae IS22]|nr:Ribosomal-protein-serine acetyltransferase [Klebsiella pneumoniae IS22]
MMLPLTTPRLLLRRFRTEDLPSFSHYRNLPEVARFQSWTHYSMTEATASMNNSVRWRLLRMRAGSSLP